MTEKTQIDYLWNKILEKAEQIINPLSFSTFIKELVPTDIANRKIILQARTEMAAGTILKNLADKLREAIAKADCGISDFKLFVENSDNYPLEDIPDAIFDDFDPTPVDKKFTFDSFVVGPSNKFVYAAAKAVADNPGVSFNPLFIYGGTGLGKTHLMQAIANNISEKKPSLKILYTTCEKFLNEFIDNMVLGRNNSRDRDARFRAHYRNVDVLIIDDIQFLANKNAVQEAFFHTFNELYQQNKQIVISSDRSPREISTLEDRLRTRFEGGLIVDIQPPDIEMKIAILKRKALEKKCVIPDDVLEYLAKDSGNDVRTLEGRLTKVLFASKLHEEPICMEIAKIALCDSVSDEKEDITPETVLRSVCSYYKISKADLLGKNKKQELVRARQICAYLMCEMLSLPLVSIGKLMGGRDHATIIYSRDKVAEQIKLNDKIAKDTDDIKSIILKK